MRENHQRREMEIEHTTGRSSLEFPLALVLLLAWMLFMCGFFCCCSHWDELQSFLRSSPSSNTQIQEVVAPPPPQKPRTPSVKIKAESLPVLMPGDEVPKFIALASPSQPSIE